MFVLELYALVMQFVEDGGTLPWAGLALLAAEFGESGRVLGLGSAGVQEFEEALERVCVHFNYKFMNQSLLVLDVFLGLLLLD